MNQGKSGYRLKHRGKREAKMTRPFARLVRCALAIFALVAALHLAPAGFGRLAARYGGSPVSPG